MNSKTHDLLRTLQWLIPALVTFFGVLDSVFQWGYIGVVETIASGLVTLIGRIAENSSKTYFSDKVIIDATNGRIEDC